MILAFDITNRESFEHVERWLLELKTNVTPGTPIILIGNKADLARKYFLRSRTVTEEEARSLSERHKIGYLETSAKTALNVNRPFYNLCQIVMRNIENGIYDLSDEVCRTQRCPVKLSSSELSLLNRRLRHQPAKSDCAC